MCRSPLLFVIAAALLFCAAHDVTLAQSTAASGSVNLLENATCEYSTDGGETFTQQALTISPRDTVRVMIRVTFDFAPPPTSSVTGYLPYAVLELNHGITASYLTMSFALNGQGIDVPLEGMFYRTIPAVDPQLLKTGQNVLTGEVTVRNRSRQNDFTFEPEMLLLPRESSELKFQTGPILGAYDNDFFTLTCRTNMPAPVSAYRLEDAAPAGGRQTMELVATSETGLIHRLRISRNRNDPEETRTYAVITERNGYMVGVQIRPAFAREERLTFAAIGDSRTNAEDWRNVASVVANSGAQFVLFAGDMVASGRRDWQWDEHFWDPGRVLLQRIPIYAVIGNHESNAPLFDEIFYTPSADGRARNWSQEKNGVSLIGIDGRRDWSAGSDNTRWLEETLAGSKAKFVFLVSHYPPWSSSDHGSLDEEGRPEERPVRQAREVIIPLLQKYKVTAMIAGHDHVYERSEPPGGVTVIITGGAGAPRYSKAEDAERQNPYSKVFAPVLHYCLFEVAGDTCTMKVLTPEGDVIDTRTWISSRAASSGFF